MGPLLTYSRAGEIPREVRETLTRAIQLKQAVVETERQIGARTQRNAELTQEQNRNRENMKTVAQSSAYHGRQHAHGSRRLEYAEVGRRGADATAGEGEAHQGAPHDVGTRLSVVAVAVQVRQLRIEDSSGRGNSIISRSVFVSRSGPRRRLCRSK